jgi:hypothetical protein
VLAISRLNLGAAAVDAWKSLGYDIDGYASSKTSPWHCKVNEGGNKAAVQTDGYAGIDNSFGENLVPIFLSLEPNVETKANEAVLEGGPTTVLAIEKLGSSKDYAALRSSLYIGSNLGAVPKWDGSDKRPVRCEWLATCLGAGTPPPPANPSKFISLNSYVASGTWVSGDRADLPVLLDIGFGYPLVVTLHHAVMAARLGHEVPVAKTATAGIISGVLDTEEFIGELHKVGGKLSTALCDGPTWENIAQQIRATSDIMKDGTLYSGAFCNGISVGIGFEMKAVQLGGALNAQPPEPNPCK